MAMAAKLADGCWLDLWKHEAGVGHDAGQAPIVGLLGQLVDKLPSETETEQSGSGSAGRESSVVESPAPTEPSPVSVEGETGDDHEIAPPKLSRDASASRLQNTEGPGLERRSRVDGGELEALAANAR